MLLLIKPALVALQVAILVSLCSHPPGPDTLLRKPHQKPNQKPLRLQQSSAPAALYCLDSRSTSPGMLRSTTPADRTALLSLAVATGLFEAEEAEGLLGGILDELHGGKLDETHVAELWEDESTGRILC